MSEKHQCAKRVYGGARPFGGSLCEINATYHENGEWWCRHHAPKITAKKRCDWEKKRDAEREHDRRLRDAGGALQIARDEALNWVLSLPDGPGYYLAVKIRAAQSDYDAIVGERQPASGEKG